MSKGKIIVFEGIDCSFKETNSKALFEYLKTVENIPKVNLIAFPTYGSPSAYFVEKFLKSEYKNNDPYFISLLYAMDRADTIERENVKERLENGEWFIFDRYVTSNVVYQCARCKDAYYYKNQLTKFIDTIEYDIIKLPRADLEIFLHCTNDDLVKKVISEKENKDKNELNLGYMGDCRNFIKKYFINKYPYLGREIIDACVNDPQFIYTNDGCEFKSEEEIKNEVIELVNKKLLNK